MRICKKENVANTKIEHTLRCAYETYIHTQKNTHAPSATERGEGCRGGVVRNCMQTRHTQPANPHFPEDGRERTHGKRPTIIIRTNKKTKHFHPFCVCNRCESKYESVRAYAFVRTFVVCASIPKCHQIHSVCAMPIVIFLLFGIPIST